MEGGKLEAGVEEEHLGTLGHSRSSEATTSAVCPKAKVYHQEILSY